MTRVNTVLNNHLSGLVDGRLEPHGIEARFGHVWNLGRVRSFESFGTNPQESVLVPLIEIDLELVGTLGPRATQLFLRILPPVVRTLDVPVRKDFAKTQGRASVATRIWNQFYVVFMVPPNNIVLIIERDPARLGPERRRPRDCDPTFHSSNKDQSLYYIKEMLVLLCVPPPPKVPKEKTRTQRLKKIWKIQKQMKKEEKDLFRELWEGRIRPVEYDLDFDDLFDTF
jgi:hypothetical protein